MRSSSLFLLTSQLARAVVGEIVVDYDPSLEGRVGPHVKVEEVVEQVFGLSQFKANKNALKVDTDGGAEDTRALLGVEAVDFTPATDTRALSCDAGYWYCASFGRCCPTTSLCCSYGYCIQPNNKCCPQGPCDPNEGCCGQSHCYPIGGECCRDESYCPPGNGCYLVPGHTNPVCCTNSRCTAHVDEHGTTTTASTTTTSSTTITTTSSQAYYWTVTWSYYYYFWTYSIAVEASVVTSTITRTSSAFTVTTTNAAAASSYFSQLSSTIDLPTPPSATSLASLAGSTSFVGPSRTSSTPSSTPLSTAGVSLPSLVAGGGPSNTVNQNGAGRAVLFQGEGLIAFGYLMFTFAVGLVAVLL